jgi:hypothetical protein
MSRVYHRAVGVSVIALMNEFLRMRFRHVDQSTATFLSAELDLAFLRYWTNAYRDHREGETPCVSCDCFDDCVTGDALSVLRPDPISGVSERFRQHVFAVGTYDLVSRYGEIHLDRIRREERS